VRFDFSEPLNVVLKQAKRESLAHGHGFVDTGHLLLGLTTDRSWPSVLDEAGIDPDEVRRCVVAKMKRGTGNLRGRRPSFTPDAKRAFEEMMQEARLLDHSALGPSHLVLGLLRVETGLAAEVLVSLGATLEQMRIHARHAGPPASRRPRPGPRMFLAERRIHAESSFRFSIDDSSPSSIYEQIIAQVNEAVATGALRPGQRLPTVRRLADELDIAPGTVARAYGELERQGVVKTEGARGTRVAERPRDPQPADERRETLVGLLRPVAVAAFHLGANSDELREALERAMNGVLRKERRD
jgi:GntR family transcriptional regulator